MVRSLGEHVVLDVQLASAVKFERGAEHDVDHAQDFEVLVALVVEDCSEWKETISGIPSNTLCKKLHWLGNTQACNESRSVGGAQTGSARGGRLTPLLLHRNEHSISHHS